jgi:WD40 repeat protein
MSLTPDDAENDLKSETAQSTPERDADDVDQEFPAAEEGHDVDLPQFPITDQVILKDHTKVVSALTLDPSGARVLSGSHDYDAKLWDFGGMDIRCKPFKSWEPAGMYYVCFQRFRRFLYQTLGSQVHDLKYSNDGQRFLVVSGTTQAKLYDRDGEEQ